MFTIVVILILAAAGALIWAYDKFKQENLIAKAIDGSGATQIVSDECQSVIKALTEKKGLKADRYSKRIVLPDGQKVSYQTDSEQTFQTRTELAFEPNAIEWKVLKGVVRKLYGDL